MGKRYIVEEVSGDDGTGCAAVLFFIGLVIYVLDYAIKWLTVNFFIPYKSYLPMIGFGFLALIASGIYSWVCCLIINSEDDNDDDSEDDDDDL
jgi:hypothetical protein